MSIFYAVLVHNSHVNEIHEFNSLSEALMVKAKFPFATVYEDVWIKQSDHPPESMHSWRCASSTEIL